MTHRPGLTLRPGDAQPAPGSVRLARPAPDIPAARRDFRRRSPERAFGRVQTPPAGDRPANLVFPCAGARKRPVPPSTPDTRSASGYQPPATSGQLPATEVRMPETGAWNRRERRGRKRARELPPASVVSHLSSGIYHSPRLSRQPPAASYQRWAPYSLFRVPCSGFRTPVEIGRHNTCFSFSLAAAGAPRFGLLGVFGLRPRLRGARSRPTSPLMLSGNVSSPGGRAARSALPAMSESWQPPGRRQGENAVSGRGRSWLAATWASLADVPRGKPSGVRSG